MIRRTCHATAAIVAGLVLAGCTSIPPAVESYPDEAARRTVVDGIDVHYFDFDGQADVTPIVWVHGYSGAAFETTYIVDHLGGRRLVAPDLPGSGYSGKPDIDYTLEFYVGFLGRFIEIVGLERYVLVGHSMGGMIASAFASRHPAGLERLVLIAPYGFDGEAGAIPEFLADTGVLVDYGLELHNETLLEIAMRTSVFHDTSRIPQDLVDYLNVSTFHTENAIPALASITRKVIAGEHDVGMLSKIDAPTLIIWGAEDRVLDFKYSARFNRLIPNSTLQAIPDCGHLPHVELPEVTAAIMREWLGPPSDGT